MVHGDDITSDSDGNDCYRYVKAAGRFCVVKRTPGISTTDLVGRMLLCTKTHFIRSLTDTLNGREGGEGVEQQREIGRAMTQRIQDYATDASGKNPGPVVWIWREAKSADPKVDGKEDGKIDCLVRGRGPKPGQRVVYVDGGFDLFSSGHIEFLKQVLETENEDGVKKGWYSDEARAARIKETGEDYYPAYIVAGIHDDSVINYWKGVNYPIMNIFERGLCVLQCRVSSVQHVSSLLVADKA